MFLLMLLLACVGPQCIVEDNVTLRGDLAVIRVGRYCLIEGGTSLVPCKAVQDG